MSTNTLSMLLFIWTQRNLFIFINKILSWFGHIFFNASERNSSEKPPNQFHFKVGGSRVNWPTQYMAKNSEAHLFMIFVHEIETVYHLFQYWQWTTVFGWFSFMAQWIYWKKIDGPNVNVVTCQRKETLIKTSLVASSLKNISLIIYIYIYYLPPQESRVRRSAFNVGKIQLPKKSHFGWEKKLNCLSLRGFLLHWLTREQMKCSSRTDTTLCF